MSLFDKLSSPLVTLFPQASPSQSPNYENAFQMQSQPLGSNLLNHSQQYTQNMTPIVQASQFTAGLQLSQSNNTVTRLKGRNMMNTSTSQSFINPLNEGRKSFSEKFQNSTFGKNYGLWSTGLGAANTAFTSIFGTKDEYLGKYGHTTQAMDSAYDTIQNFAGNFGPVGQAVSLGMGANKLLGNVVNKLGGGTDGMTKVDSILGSSFLQLTPFGLINGFGGKRAATFDKDEETFEQIGSSYTGSNSLADKASGLSGKKYGAFSSGARDEANRTIAQAQAEQNAIQNILENRDLRRALSTSMSSINGLRNNYFMSGGLDTSNIRVGKNGMNIELLNRARKVVKQSQKLQTGGVISDPFEVYLQSLPQAQRDSTNFRVRDYWEYNGRPKNFDEARKKGMFEWKEDFDESGKSLGWSWHANSVAYNSDKDEYEFMKSSFHPSVQEEINWYNSGKPDAVEFRREYELQKVQPYYKYVKRKAPYKDVPVHKGGGSIIELVSLPTEILLVDPNEVPEFQEGGSINVIPDGALHARKHNMDIEGITKKGIPVIDNDGEQQAEIECEELIIRLEVTKKLEELEKKFYDSETSQKEKDEYALEAGKLLVEEILYNTQDNTNSLL